MAAALPYLLSIGGAAIASKSANDVASRQRQIIEAMRAYQVGKAQTGQDAIKKYLATLTPEARDADKTDATATLQQGLQRSVDATKSYQLPQNFSGKVSDAYTNRVAQDTSSNNDRISRAMQQLAVIGTPQEQQLRNSLRFAKAGTDVDAANSAIRDVTPAFTGAAGRVVPNPWDTFFSQALVGAGQAAGDRGRPKKAAPYQFGSE